MVLGLWLIACSAVVAFGSTLQRLRALGVLMTTSFADGVARFVLNDDVVMPLLACVVCAAHYVLIVYAPPAAAETAPPTVARAKQE